MPHDEGMELWAIVPELVLAGAVLVLLTLASLLPIRHKGLTTWLALAVLAAAGVTSARMVAWEPREIFIGTYAVDPFAVFFKLFAIAGTALVLLVTHSHFKGRPHGEVVPALLVLTCLGSLGLAASQELTLIALFVQLVTVGSYILAGIAKEDGRATEGALKLFLFSAAASAVMLYGMALLYGLTGTLQLPELAGRLAGAPTAIVLASLGFVLAGYAYKSTIVPFHSWAPDTYQGAPTPIAGFLSVVPKAAGLAVLLRTLVVAFPDNPANLALILAVLAAITMTAGNILALRQTSAKRLLAYSSIAQAGYLLVGIAAAGLDALAVPGFLFYLAVYLFMNLGAFLAVEAIERRLGSDDLSGFGGLGRHMPFTSAALTLALLSLASIPPLGGFVGKAMLFGAALGAGWLWLGAVMGVNVAISLYYYLRVVQPMYFGPSSASRRFSSEPLGLRLALAVLTVGVLLTGVLPEVWVSFAEHASSIFAVDSTAR